MSFGVWSLVRIEKSDLVVIKHFYQHPPTLMRPARTLLQAAHRATRAPGARTVLGRSPALARGYAAPASLESTSSSSAADAADAAGIEVSPKPPQFGQPLALTHPHLVRQRELTPGITAEEYEDRRRRLMDSLPAGSVVVCMGGTVRLITQRECGTVDLGEESK